MKNLIIVFNLIILVAITSIFTQSDTQRKDGATNTARKNAVGVPVNPSMKSDFATWSGAIADKSASDDVVSNFLQTMTETRIMDLEQGKTAEQRATTRPLKRYGTLMVKDQSRMLEELRALAAIKKIPVSDGLSREKADALADLKAIHGESFDKKFIKMMIKEHNGDVKKLENACYSDDADIQVFATKYLPVVQTHLDQIKALKKDR